MNMKVVPHLCFYCSRIYDKQIYDWKGKKWKNASKKATNYISKLSKNWSKVEKRLLMQLLQFLG